ncbi:MAG: hypothetical protein ABI647_02650 [Gemmatimonadota bacterium]
MPQPKVQRVLAVSAGILAAGAIGWWLLGLYSVSSPWDQFEKPAREFFEAAVARDSGRLKRLASPAALAFVLERAAQDSGSFSVLGPLVAMKGRRTGDTSRVVFLNGGCRNHMVTITFVGLGKAAKVRDFTPPCAVR